VSAAGDNKTSPNSPDSSSRSMPPGQDFCFFRNPAFTRCSRSRETAFLSSRFSRESSGRGHPRLPRHFETSARRQPISKSCLGGMFAISKWPSNSRDIDVSLRPIAQASETNNRRQPAREASQTKNFPSSSQPSLYRRPLCGRKKRPPGLRHRRPSSLPQIER